MQEVSSDGIPSSLIISGEVGLPLSWRRSKCISSSIRFLFNISKSSSSEQVIIGGDDSSIQRALLPAANAILTMLPSMRDLLESSAIYPLRIKLSPSSSSKLSARNDILLKQQFRTSSWWLEPSGWTWNSGSIYSVLRCWDLRQMPR
jgi:hypothetical protein